MCCRCYIEYLKDDELRKLYNTIADKSDLKIEGEIYPTDNMMVLARTKDNRVGVFKMKWGYSITKKNVFNARIETLKTKDLFKNDLLLHRCIIPVNNYFEWQKSTKTKFNIHADSNITYLLGLYHLENSKPVFTIITKDASEMMKAIHNRMPLVIEKEEVTNWLSESANIDECFSKSLNELIYKEA